VETGRPTIPKASPKTLAVTRVDGSPGVVGCSPNTMKAAVASFGAAEVPPGCNGVAGGCVRARIRELLRLFPRMPATANRGADRLAAAVP
jgi:hypothetical protein